MMRRDVEFYPPLQPYWVPTLPEIEFCPPSPPWVSERQTFSSEPNWTPEEDEKLLKLEELCYGRWSQIPHLLSHSPFHYEVRCSQLKDQQMELQDKERQKQRHRTLAELESRISNLENDMKTLKDQSLIASESLKKLKQPDEYENQLKLEIANKLDPSRDC